MTLDAATRAELKDQLLAEKERLERDLGVVAERTDAGYEARFPEVGPDEDENATEVDEFTGNLGVENALVVQLRDVTDALARMEVGTYGICEKTGKEIPLARLRAYPAARTVVEA